jgi:DNA-directed RNA polymerase subunit RPC12/RpoP
MPRAETNVPRASSHILVPFPGNHPHIYTPPFSQMGSHSNDFISDHEAFPATMPIHGPMQDVRTATNALDEVAMYLSSSSQVSSPHPYSAVYPPNPTLISCRPLNRYSNHDEAAPSDFRLERRGRQFVTTDASIPLRSRVSEHRNSKKYRCHPCDSTFAQKQGLNRHVKDKHLHQNLCPYCSDFAWSPGRSYRFSAHLRSEHPAAALPKARS